MQERLSTIVSRWIAQRTVTAPPPGGPASLSEEHHDPKMIRGRHLALGADVEAFHVVRTWFTPSTARVTLGTMGELRREAPTAEGEVSFQAHLRGNLDLLQVTPGSVIGRLSSGDSWMVIPRDQFEEFA